MANFAKYHKEGKSNNEIESQILHLFTWMLSKDVVLAVQYKVYLVSQAISLIDTVQYWASM